MDKITYVGLNLLDHNEKDSLMAIVGQHAKKLERIVPKANLMFHVKLHEIGGRMKYSLHSRVKVGKEMITAEASDYDLHRTSHKVMDKLMNGIEHKLHTEGQQQQKFHPKKAKRGYGKQVKLKLRRRAKIL